MRVAAQIDVAAPPEAVWEFIVDPERYLHFMSGVTRWESAGDQRMGLGARYRLLMRVGSAEVGGTVEITEYDEPRDMAWNSVTGVDQRGRWRVRERGHRGHPSRSHVEFRLSYGVAGAGLLGWLSERFSAPMVTNNLRRSLQQLKRAVEHEQLRRAAAARRTARASA
jgi:carbon monoxide dehydrogenase subunit G